LMLPMSNQSLKNLHMVYYGENAPLCSPCKENESEIFWGMSKTFTNRDDQQKNWSGRCVQTAEFYLSSMGFSKGDVRNPAWLNFVGTWQQAETRLQRWQKTQNTMYDTGLLGPALWPTYYAQKVILKIDIWVKKAMGLTNRTSVSVGEVKRRGVDGDMWGYVVGVVHSAKDKTLEFIQFAGAFIWKFITMVIRSPAMAMLVQKFAGDMRTALCKEMAKARNKVKWSRTSTAADGAETVQEFDPKNRRWLDLEPDEQKTFLKTADAARKATVMMRAYDLLTATEAMWGTSDGMGSHILSVARSSCSTIVETMTSAISKILSVLNTVLGGVLETLQKHTGRFVNSIMNALKSVVKGQFDLHIGAPISKQYEYAYRTYSNIFGIGPQHSGCSFKTGMMMKDGVMLGETGLLGGESVATYGVAWSKILVNIPFYALCIVKEIAAEQVQFGGEVNDERILLFAYRLAATEMIENHPNTQRQTIQRQKAQALALLTATATSKRRKARAERPAWMHSDPIMRDDDEAAFDRDGNYTIGDKPLLDQMMVLSYQVSKGVEKKVSAMRSGLNRFGEASQNLWANVVGSATQATTVHLNSATASNIVKGGLGIATATATVAGAVAVGVVAVPASIGATLALTGVALTKVAVVATVAVGAGALTVKSADVVETGLKSGSEGKGADLVAGSLRTVETVLLSSKDMMDFFMVDIKAQVRGLLRKSTTGLEEGIDERDMKLEQCNFLLVRIPDIQLVFRGRAKDQSANKSEAAYIDVDAMLATLEERVAKQLLPIY
jgi:hypothetical protein